MPGMKMHLDCIPCFVQQAVRVIRMVTTDPGLQEDLLKKALELAGAADFAAPPPTLAQRLHRMIRTETGNPDPYSELKTRFNRLALGLLPELEERVRAASDPFEAAVRISIAGNIIDFGTVANVGEEIVAQSLNEAFTSPLPEGMIAVLREAVQSSRRILFLGDNTGEIVLDKLLVAQLPPEKTTYVVRGGPILNDATIKDAREVGMNGLVDVIDNGSDAPGTVLEDCPVEFQQRYHDADLIISKGQGNYETLDDTGKNIFFLLKAKCPVVAGVLNLPLGSIALVNRQT